MKGIFALLPLLIAPAIGIAAFVLIVASSIGTYLRARQEIFTYAVRAALALAVWFVATVMMALCLLSYVSGPDYVVGVEPPIVLRAVKYLGLVSIYCVLGSILVWWMKQEESYSLKDRHWPPQFNERLERLVINSASVRIEE